MLFVYIVHVNTSLLSEANVAVYEGASVNISCISFGIPVPTISWKLNNQATPFKEVDESTDTISSEGEFIPGSRVSTLKLVDVKYPTDEGIYTCNGSNIYTTSTVMVVLQIFGMYTAICLDK